jgi:hypothetical protein
MHPRRPVNRILSAIVFFLAPFGGGCVPAALVGPSETNSSLIIGRVVINNQEPGRLRAVLPIGIVVRDVEVLLEGRDGTRIPARTDEHGYFFIPNIAPNNYHIRHVKFEGTGNRGAWASKGYAMQRLPFTPAPGKAGYIGTLYIDIDGQGIGKFKEAREDDSARAYYLQLHGASPWAKREFAAIGAGVPRTEAAAPHQERPTMAKTAGGSAKAQRPEWKVGYEWRYSWKEHSGNGSITKEIVREDVFSGIPAFVIKRGKYEDFYAKDILGVLGSMVDGQITTRRNAPFQTLSWPLEVGKEWGNSYILENLGKKTSESLDHRTVARSFEEVKVPAGTFNAYKIEVYNARTGGLRTEYWYAPQVKWFVKSRVHNRDGIREEELLSYKVD